MKNVVCIIARTKSQRLKEKVLKEINGITMIEYIIRKMKRSRYATDIYMCTSNLPTDKLLVEIAIKNGIKVYEGDPDAPIERMMRVAEIENADNVVRVTGDNIFCDEVYLDLMFKYQIENNADYTRTEYLPSGVTPEIISAKALKTCFDSMPKEYSEYLLIYIFQPKLYKCQVLIPVENHRHQTWSLTVDNPDDWQRTCEIIGSNTKILKYSEIVEICTNSKIHNLEFKAGDSVKFPAKMILTYKTYRTEMDQRIEDAHIVSLGKNEYEDMVKFQES